MFYVSRRLDDTHFGVIDTEDGKEDIFTASELRKLDDTYEINGVGNEGICPVRTPNEVLSILRSNDLHLAIRVRNKNKVKTYWWRDDFHTSSMCKLMEN